MYETVREAVENRDFKKVKELFTQLNEADIADLIQGFHDNQEVDARDISLLFRLLPKDMAAEVFTYMDSDMKELLINSFTDTELQEVIDNLFIDDTVDLIEEMPANAVARILRASDPQSRRMINMILKYPEDSAGSIMTTEYIYMKKDSTVKETLDKIRALRSFAGDSLDIEVDGGINGKTAPLVKEAGANVLVAGTGLFKAEDMAQVNSLLKAPQKGQA